MTTFTTQDRIHAEKDGSFTIDCRPKPLTEEQIKEIWHQNLANMGNDLEFARAIEKAHGIR